MKILTIVFAVFLILLVAPVQIGMGIMQKHITKADSELRNALVGPEPDTSTQKTLEPGPSTKTGISIENFNTHGYFDILLGILTGLSGVLLIVGQVKQHFIRFALVPVIIVSVLWILSSISNFVSGSKLFGGIHHPLLLLPVLPAIILAGIAIMNYISNIKYKGPDEL